MLSKQLMVCRQYLAVAFGNALKTRKISEFKMRDARHWPGDDLQSRTYKRIWFNQHEKISDGSPEAPVRRLDDTMYRPRRWREREYQSTWRESMQAEEELESEKKDVKKEEPRHQKPAPRNTNAMPQRLCDPKKRLQKVAIPAGVFLSNFISDQEKRKMQHYEAEVVVDRLSNDEYQLS